MITPNVPPPVSPTNIETVQYDAAKADESMLHRQHVAPIIKTLVLRYMTQREINENEAQDILTGVTLYDMQSGKTLLGHNENTEHFAASINKLPVTLLILEELRAGNITLDTVLTWQESDRRDGAGVFDAPGSPLSAKVSEILTDLLTRSGNTAVRILVNGVLGGPYSTNDRLANIPELTHTRLIPLDATRFYLGNTTSRESLYVLRQLMKAQDIYGQYVKNALVNNIYTEIGVKSQLGGNDFIVLVNKIGQLNDPDGNNRHDVGIVYNTKTHKAYGFSYLTTAPSASEAATAQAEQSLKDMGRYLLRYNGDWPTSKRPMPLQAAAPTESKKIQY